MLRNFGRFELHVAETRFYYVPLKCSNFLKQALNLAEVYWQNFFLIGQQLKFQPVSSAALSLSHASVAQGSVEIWAEFYTQNLGFPFSRSAIFRISPLFSSWRRQSFSVTILALNPFYLWVFKPIRLCVLCWHFSCLAWNSLGPALRFKLLKKKREKLILCCSFFPDVNPTPVLPVLFILQFFISCSVYSFLQEDWSSQSLLGHTGNRTTAAFILKTV